MLSSTFVTILTYLACIGWGWLVSMIVRMRTPADLGLIAAWGMAFSTVFGGVLSLLGVSWTPVLRVYVLLGAFLAVMWGFRALQRWQANSHWKRPAPWTLAAMITLGILVLLRVMASSVPGFNYHDDFQGYLVFPIRMLQTGSFGAEPFNERRLLALGGQTFLQALQLAWGSWRQANSTDLGLGWLVCTGLIAGHAAQRRALPLAALFLLLAIQFDHPPAVNISSTVTGLALQYALLRTFLLESPSGSHSRLMLLALTIAGLCSLKNSLLAGCVFALAALWLASSHEVRWRRLVELSVAGVVAGLFLIPWMIELHRSSGTWFFPILGKGFHGSVYGSFPDVTAGLHFAGIVHTLVSFSWRSRETLALGILPLLSPLVIRGSKSRDYRSWVLLSLGTWVGAFILFIQSGTVRYGYPFVMAAIFFLLAEYLPTTAEIARRFEARRLAVAALLAFFLGINYREGLYPYVAAVARWDPQPDRHPYPYQNAQAAVPEGAIVLACLSHPFMLDFKRNPIYTVDHAGGASPPPGIPVLGSDEELVAYLRRQSVRYVMYSYSDEASYGRIDAGESLKAGGNAYDDRARKLAEYNIAFRDHLSALAQQGTKVFDDGEVFVLDLESLKQPIPG